MSYLKPLKSSAVLPRVRLVFVIAAAMMTVGMLEAQTANWVELGTPSARCCMGMAYDGATYSTVLFGGSCCGGGASYMADTWIWRGGWQPTSPATSPSPRNASIAYDGAAGNVVLFGGYTSTGAYLNDTWTWDGTTWTQQFPSVSPSARIGPMAYDEATKTVVLFGGGTVPVPSAILGPGMG